MVLYLTMVSVTPAANWLNVSLGSFGGSSMAVSIMLFPWGFASRLLRPPIHHK